MFGVYGINLKKNDFLKLCFVRIYFEIKFSITDLSEIVLNHK